MLKWIGVLLLVAGTTGVGCSFRADMQERLRQIQYMVHIMEQMKSEIGYYREPLPALCERLAGAVKEPYRSFFRSIAEKMEENRGVLFDAVWREESRRMTARMPLAQEEKELWERFCEYMGYGDGQMQETAILSQITEMEHRKSLLQEELGVRGKVYVSLGAAGGLLLAIILF